MDMNPEIKLTTQTEKPNHYTYLKEFRVEQCTSFLQHKCNQHKPFVCFNWHFDNQRRRRPVRRRDGTFNYSADNYCTKYDETKGKCPDGDECPFLHRTAGDTERRYHLRYYKTCMCVHDTDSRGYCVKNGQHCAFAHGVHDQRPPVYDIKELEALQTVESVVECVNGPNVLDKERNLMNEDPKWQDTNFVLANYKTDQCKRPPRLCRQGYACPQYHNSKDKRRSPRKYKYRSTPCPNVKHGEEWGEPDNCEAGDGCQYCHTRTEQQFHPEIYKSTKCNDVQQQGYCPRSVFCAFAHVQPYGLGDDMPLSLDAPGALAFSDIICGSLDGKLINDKNDLAFFTKVLQNGNAESSESASTSSIGSNNSSHNKAPGAQLHQHKNMNNTISNSINSNGINSLQSTINNNSNSLLNPYGYDLDNSISAGILSSSLHNSTAPVNIPGSPLTNSLTGMLKGSNPVNIPGGGSSTNNFSPSNPNLFNMGPGGDSFMPMSGAGSAPKINSNSFGHNDNLFLQHQHLISPSGLSISPDLRINELNNDQQHNNNNNSNSNNLFNNDHNKHSFPLSPMMGNNYTEISRLREELAGKQAFAHFDDHRNKPYDIWKTEIDENNRKVTIVEKQRDDALGTVKVLTEKVEQLRLTNFRSNELRGMPIQKLKNLQSKLRTELEEVESVLYSQTATKCMKCEENNRSVTLAPCNHYVLCEKCAKTQRECPYCMSPVTSTS
ncbi:unnamed protein product [Diamesa serratosioi]